VLLAAGQQLGTVLLAAEGVRSVLLAAERVDARVLRPVVEELLLVLLASSELVEASLVCHVILLCRIRTSVPRPVRRRISGHAGFDLSDLPDASTQRHERRWGRQLEARMDKETYDNVLTALQGEAFAHARYAVFATAARERGDERLASMFDGIAAVELREHFAELAQLVGLVGTDADNIRAALQDETFEVESRYPEFAEQALAAEHDAVAERFAEMAEDEREHERTLQEALSRLEVPA
jgi:rubrerythrin